MLAGAKAEAVLWGGEGGVLDADWSWDGSRVALCGEDGFAALHDAKTDHRRLALLTGHEDEVSQVAFNPRGSRLLTSSADGTARLWAADEDRPGHCLQVLIGHQDEVFSSSFSYEGDVIVTG